jgi:tRNA modification GTPase
MNFVSPFREPPTSRAAGTEQAANGDTKFIFGRDYRVLQPLPCLPKMNIMSPCGPMSPADTIYALSTPPGVSGIAVIRLSGPHAGPALTALAGALPPPRRLTRRWLHQPGTAARLDDGMVAWLPGPASYTAEDMAELHTHGGRAVVAAVLAALGGMPGLRAAEAGEFTRRAFANGRLDLTAAEGLADLLAAETEAQRRLALGQLGDTSAGRLGQRAEAWREQLIQAMALVEAMLDFSDEGDVDSEILQRVPVIAAAVRAEMAEALASAPRAEIVREGFRVVLAGPPNAGKSSLLNALLQRDAAIVSPEAGTTRDVIEARLDLDGQVVIVSDTAGLRAAEGDIEREGIRRSLAAAARADLVLWLIDPAAPQVEPAADLAALGVPVLPVWSKADLVLHPGARASALAVSAVTGAGLPTLLDHLAAAVRERTGGTEGLLVTRARQRDALTDAHGALTSMLDHFPDALELRAEDLRLATHALARLTGRVDAEAVLDQIFGAFCIGK